MSVRGVYLVIFILAIIHLFHSLSYTIIIQIDTALAPLKNYDERISKTNATQEEKYPHIPGNLKVPVQQHQINSTGNNSKGLHVARGLGVKIITENSQICPNLGQNIKLFIAITSAPSHETTRLAIRETWGNKIRKDIAIAFILGTSSNSSINKKIEKEQLLYDDIIVGKFIDTYENLTLKSISMLEWINNYCPKASFILKTDDDVFINVPKLLTFITKHNPKQRAIYGRLAKKWKPVRKKKSKYYISSEQYKAPVFPDFTTGPAYLFPTHLSKELYLAASNLTYFKLEDVFVTGIVAHGLKIKRIHVPEFLNEKVHFTPCNIQKTISIHTVKSFEQYYLWKEVHDVVKCKKVKNY